MTRPLVRTTASAAAVPTIADAAASPAQRTTRRGPFIAASMRSAGSGATGAAGIWPLLSRAAGSPTGGAGGGGCVAVVGRAVTVADGASAGVDAATDAGGVVDAGAAVAGGAAASVVGATGRAEGTGCGRLC